MIHATAKVSEETTRNMPVRNTLIQLLVLYTDPERQSAALQTDRQTDDMMMPIAEHTVQHYDRLKTCYVKHDIRNTQTSLTATIFQRKLTGSDKM